MTFDKPKLFESLRYGGTCAVCGDEVTAGEPGWVFGKACACAGHKPQMVIEAVSRPKDALSGGGDTSDTAVALFTLTDLLQGIDETLAHMDVTLGNISSVLREAKK